jgi:hypothetical protein
VLLAVAYLAEWLGRYPPLEPRLRAPEINGFTGRCSPDRFGARPDRGRTYGIVGVARSLILQAIDEIGMSLDRTASSSRLRWPALEVASRPPFVQPGHRALGRLREAEAVPVLRSIVEQKKLWGRTQHRECA